MTIGERIAERRKSLGMTQEQLAKKLGYTSKSTINKIELGINELRQTKVVAFADALDTTPAYLMGWVEEIDNPEANNEPIIDYADEIPRESARKLFQSLRGATAEEIDAAVQIIEALRK